MSDARVVVQPRWKRRATEIAEAIGGSSGGVSSVSLDSNTITELSQAIADAIDLKTLDINIRQYDNDFVSSAGIPIRTGTGPVSGGFLPLRVVTDIGDVVDTNVKQFNDVEVDTRGLPVQAGRSISNNTLVPLVVNCPTTNNFPGGTGGTGGTSLTQQQFETAMDNALANASVAVQPALDANNVAIPLFVTETAPVTSSDVTLVRLGKYTNGTYGPGLSPSIHLPITGDVNCRQDQGSLTPWIISSGIQGHPTLGQWGNTTVATTETVPVTTVSVDNHPTSVAVQPALDANNVAIPLSVTETNPVSGGGSGSTTFPSTMDVNIVKFGGGATISPSLYLPVIESAPVTAVAVNNLPTVQDVKIVGDTTTGIIMSKSYWVSGIAADYTSVGFGLGASAYQTDVQNGVSPNNNLYSDGWTIRVNGVDIFNQDISNDLRNGNHVPAQTLSNPNYNNATLATLYPRLIQADSQPTIDKYHGRKVTLSSVWPNIWIVEPLSGFKNTGYVSGASGSKWTITVDDGTIKYYQDLWNNNTSPSGTNSSDRSHYYGARVVLYEGTSTDTHSDVDQLWVVIGIDDA